MRSILLCFLVVLSVTGMEACRFYCVNQPYDPSCGQSPTGALKNFANNCEWAKLNCEEPDNGSDMSFYTQVNARNCS
ncbi:hypothetical protein Bhyg_12828 [Pseudolycoriella hygida]|uniref:Uncharacterized protein n=1 Tax=Pseudolycoriella hygida TaxID=35572 RepID=A0A9Q0MZ01_9DIPT|nr:hypothetical protein Bhyg_12828 [Pseudolycoriella hygida]